jgi:hypothetical protein
MKTKFLFVVLFVSSSIFSQSINDYMAVMIPIKYDFISSENQYRLNTITKVNLNKAGFVAYFTNQTVPSEYSDRCSLLNVDVLKDSGFLTTKLYVVFKDCNGKEIFKSEIGKSREKDFGVAYTEALNDAFTSVYALHYKYNGGAKINKVAATSTLEMPIVATTVVSSAIPSTTTDDFSLFAQPIKNGFQLIDSTPKIVMKIYSTTNPSVFLATKDSMQGVLLLKDKNWFFEYYDNETLLSEKIAVKF